MEAHLATRVAVSVRHRVRLVAALAVMAVLIASSAHAQDDVTTVRGDSISIRIVDGDMRSAIQALSRYLDRPVAFASVPAGRVTLVTPRPVARSDVLGLLKGILENQGMELVDEAGLYRVRAKEQPRPLPATPSDASATGRRSGVPELFVLRLKHARAADVAATVNALYGRASALGEIGGVGRTLSQQLREQQVPPSGTAPPQAVTSVAGRAAEITGEITIVPDAGTNSLLIRASRQDFELIQAAVIQVDVRPLQVMVEVLIAEVRRNRLLSFGLSTSAGPVKIGGTTNTTVSGSTAGGGVGDFVLQIMNLGSIDLDATLNAAAARGDVQILSRPVVIAANNELAEINVGRQRPFVQVSRSLPTDSPTRDQIVQYKDVGTRLSVRPTISADGYVMLEVTQEDNKVSDEASGLEGVLAPVISTRSVQTQLLIKDGQTVALGGLSDRQRDVSQGGVPFLSDIPWIGGLFGRSKRETLESELFLFLTPRIIRTDEEADAVTAPMREKAKRAEP